MWFWKKCKVCGAKNSGSANVCQNCGAALNAPDLVCSCGRPIPAGVKVCPFCGRDADGHVHVPLEERAAGSVSGVRWARPADAVAARVDEEDLSRNEIEITHGTRALLLENGAVAAELPPGKYKPKRLMNLFRPNTSRAFLITDVGDILLNVSVDGATSDRFPVTLSMDLVLNLTDPGVFLSNVMKARRTVTYDQLREILQNEMDAVIAHALSGMSREALLDLSAIRDNIEAAIRTGLNRTLERSGLRAVQLRLWRVSFQGLDDVEAARIEANVAVEGRYAELEALEVARKLERRKIEIEVADDEERLALLERMKSVENRQKMISLSSDDEWAAYKREVDRRQLLQDADWEKLQRKIRAEGHLDELKQQELVEELESQIRHTRAMRDIKQKHLQQLESARLAQTLDLEQYHLERQKQEHELAQKEARSEKETLIEERRKTLELKAQLERELFSEQSREKKLAIQNRIRMAEADADRYEQLQNIAVLKEMTAIKEQEKLNELERELRRKREMAEMLKGLTPEQMAVLMGGDAADNLAKVMGFTYGKEMTADQLLALRGDPATMSERERQLYERMLTDKDTNVKTALDAVTTIANREIQREREAGEKAEKFGERMTETAERFGTAALGGASGSIVCPGCGTRLTLETRECPNCGIKFD